MLTHIISKQGAIGLVLLLALWLLSAPVFASTKLLMVEQRGCHYCEQWLAEIGDRYHLTDEGRIAPLQRIYLGDRISAGLPETVADVSVTPTFVLVHDGSEIARLLGYAGPDFFWSQLQEMLDKLPPQLLLSEK